MMCVGIRSGTRVAVRAKLQERPLGAGASSMVTTTSGQRVGILVVAVIVAGALFWRPHVSQLSEWAKHSSWTFRGSSHSTEESRKIRILHLIDRATEESVMDRWFPRSHHSFLEQSDLVEEAVLWGKDFPGYNSDLSLRDNLIKRFGRPDHFDAILPHYNQDQPGHLGWDPGPYFLEIAEVSRDGVVIIDRPHECRDGRRFPILDLANVTLFLAPYANELMDHRAYMSRTLLVHQPHPINPDLFFHDVASARPQDIYLAGSQELGLYPLRHRLGRMIESGFLPNAAIRPHPGYPDIMPPEERVKLGITEEFLEQQLVDYSRAFGRSKILIVTASRWEYSVQKYSEAAAAGALIIGTIPSDRYSAFEEFVVPISMRQTDEEIREVFERWLADEPGRLARARKGQQWVLENFSDRRYVEDVVRWIKAVQRGQRGFVMPYEFTDLPDPLPEDG